jgi:hypothetical protein
MPVALASQAARRFGDLRASLKPPEKIRFDRKAWDSWLESLHREARSVSK